MPRFVDEHRIRIAAPRDRVWGALRRYVDASLAKERDNPLIRLLGTEPRSGFAVSREVPVTQLGLSGRHRFSRYLLVFELGDAGDEKTAVSARTFADFPGVHGDQDTRHRQPCPSSQCEACCARSVDRASADVSHDEIVHRVEMGDSWMSCARPAPTSGCHAQERGHPRTPPHRT